MDNNNYVSRIKFWDPSR